LHPPLEKGKLMSTSSAFIYENLPEAHTYSFICLSHSQVVCSSKFKRMISAFKYWDTGKYFVFGTESWLLMQLFLVFKFRTPLTSSLQKII
jgi:hypothetical protein